MKKKKKPRTVKRSKKKQLWQLGEFVTKLARKKQAGKKSGLLI